jgi:hypothetical protein
MIRNYVIAGLLTSSTWVVHLQGQAPPQLRLEHVRTIGAPRIEFGRIAAVVGDPSGRVYVLDALAKNVVVVDSSGAVVRRLGREGEGPGEFASPIDLAWHGGRLAVLDSRLRRVTFWNQDGQVAETWRWPAEGQPVRLMGSGSNLFGITQVPRSPTEVEPGILRYPQPTVRYIEFESSGSPRILTAVADTGVQAQGFQCRGTGVIQGFGPLFPTGPLRALAGSGQLAMASSEALRVSVVDIRTGVSVRAIQSSRAPQAVTDEDWDQATRGYREAEQRNGPLACDLANMRPRFRPVVRAVVSDDQNRFWLEVSAPRGFALALYDANGRSLGEVPIPSRDHRVAPYVRQGRLYLVTIDDLGVQSVDVYRMSGVPED